MNPFKNICSNFSVTVEHRQKPTTSSSSSSKNRRRNSLGHKDHEKYENLSAYIREINQPLGFLTINQGVVFLTVNHEGVFFPGKKGYKSFIVNGQF